MGYIVQIRRYVKKSIRGMVVRKKEEVVEQIFVLVRLLSPFTN